MVPANRLLLWVAIGVVPFGAVGTMVPGALLWCVLPVLVLAIAAGWDAWRGLREGRGMGAALPASVRLFVGRPGSLDLELSSEGFGGRHVRLGLAWPEDLRAEPAELEFDWPAGTAKMRVSWQCTGWRRGRRHLRSCHLELTSPWGFWAVRRNLPQSCELRLYPNLLGERRQVSSVFLPRGGWGAHQQRVVGKGREFEKLREYVPGDSYEDIHWKATAKRGRPVTKLFQMERTQEVYVILDASRLSARTFASSASRAATALRSPIVRGTSGPAEDPGAGAEEQVPALERYVGAGLVLALAAERESDRFGLLTFADRVQGFLRASNGRAHFNACRDLLLGVEQREVAPDFEEMFALVRLRLRHRALLVILTALDDPVVAEGFARGVDLVSRQHLVLVNQLALPGVAPLFGGSMPAAGGELYPRLAGHLRWHGLRELQGRLRRHGVRLSSLDHERLSADLVAQYLDVKRRQRL